MSETESDRISRRLREYLDRLRDDDQDTRTKAEDDFRKEVLDFIRDMAVRHDPFLAADDMAEVIDEAFRYIFRTARKKRQKSLTVSDCAWAVSLACTNRQLREYLPLLRAGRPDALYDFCQTFYDCAMRAAVKIYHRRDPNGIARLDDDDLASAVHDAFMAILKNARLGLLKDLTWPYVTRAIYLALTRILRSGWQRASREVELEDEIVNLLVDEDAVCLFAEEYGDWVEEIFVAAALTEEEKQVVLLKLFGVKTCEQAKSMDSAELKGRTWAEAAGTLKISESTARRWFKKALSKLRDWYNREFG